MRWLQLKHFRSQIDSWTQYLRDHRSFSLVLLMTSFGGFLRFWRLPETLQFLGDQGRDALVASKIFLELDPVFIGPVTSVGNMYLGPLYYYFMLPFQLLSYPSPMGPVYAVAAIGTISIPILYWVAKQLFGAKTALFATLLFTVNPVIIEYTRFSWNPNPAPLISMLMMYATYKAWRESSWWWVAVSACFSVLIQLHYLTLLSAGGAGIIFIIQLIERFRSSNEHAPARESWTQWSLHLFLAAVLFLASLTPLVLFDIKHDFLNAKGLASIVLGDGGTTRSLADTMESIWKATKEIHGRSLHFLFEITIGNWRLLNTTLLLMTLTATGWITAHFHHSGKHPKRDALIVILAYIVTAIIGTAPYKGSVFNHYILYVVPAVFILFGVLFAELWKVSRYTRVARALILSILGYYIVFSLLQLPLKPIGWQLQDIRHTSERIVSNIQPNTPYNIVLLTGTGDLYGMNYRYFLHTSDNAPVAVEAHGNAETLVIINETEQTFDPTNTDIHEVQVFPDKNIDTVYTVADGPTLLFLRTEDTTESE